MLMVFGDRATYEVDGDPVPIDEIAVSTAKKWFKKNLRFVDPERHVRYQVELARGSEALRDIFSRKGKFYGANDTSAAVGYAPLTDSEKIILHTERYINSPSFKKEFPETCEDVKIMGSWEGKDIKPSNLRNRPTRQSKRLRRQRSLRLASQPNRKAHKRTQSRGGGAHPPQRSRTEASLQSRLRDCKVGPKQH